MKTIEDILTMNDKEKVVAVAGILVAIDTPREPTEAQAARNIHVQQFRIQSSKGATLDCQMLNAAMHLSPDLRGSKIILKSADTEKGPSGLNVNIYNGKLSLVVSKDASFVIKETQQPAPEAQASPDETYKLLKQREVVVTPKAHSTRPSLSNAVQAYVRIYREMKAELPEADAATLTFPQAMPALATIFIEGARGGWLYEAPPLPPPLPMVKKEEVTADPNQVLKHILSDAINGSLSNRVAQADRAIESSDTLTWDSVYDGIVSYISVEEKIPLKELLPIANSVFDSLRLQLGPKSATVDISRAVALDYETFSSQVRDALALRSDMNHPESSPEVP